MNVVLLIALATAGCAVAETAPSPSSPPAQPTRPPPESKFEHDMMMRYHMRQNFGALRAIEHSLITGHLEAARALASTIANTPSEPGATWAYHQTRVRDFATALARAPDTKEACKRVARLAAACAGCHAATNTMIALDVPAEPIDQPTIAARMARHVWATDRMWEAVIGDDDDAWVRGLDVLAQTPLPFRLAYDGRAELARRLQQLATDARTMAKTDDALARAHRYGDLLYTCAACHTRAP